MSDRFDEFAKHLGAQDDRRGLLRAAAGGTLGLLGLSALQDDARGEELEALSNRNCDSNKDCGKNQRCVKKGTKDKNCGKNDKCKCKKK
jgi:sigma54-dependent transcription regulator